MPGVGVAAVGAAGAVVSASWWGETGGGVSGVLVVPDTLLALQDIARAHRRRHGDRSAFILVVAEEETLETVIVHATDEQVRGLSKYLQALATIGNIAPLLGLLGTVIGMIKAFMVIQEMGGKVNAAVLAGGIWEAMLTTALGLSVALPTIIAHSYLVSLVGNHEARLQSGAVTFMKAINR